MCTSLTILKMSFSILYAALQNRVASTKSPHDHPTPRSPTSTTPPSISPLPTTPTRVSPQPQSNLLIDLSDEAEESQEQYKASTISPLGKVSF